MIVKVCGREKNRVFVNIVVVDIGENTERSQRGEMIRVLLMVDEVEKDSKGYMRYGNESTALRNRVFLHIGKCHQYVRSYSVQTKGDEKTTRKSSICIRLHTFTAIAFRSINICEM